MVISKDI
jgi:hypothetical protein